MQLVAMFPRILMNVTVAVAVLAAAFAFAGQPASAQSAQERVQTGLDATAGAAGLDGRKDLDLPAEIGRIIGFILSFVGVVFLGLMIYGGFTWMLARGNDSEVSKAKGIIISAIIGIIIVAGAYAITATVLRFVVPGAEQ